MGESTRKIVLEIKTKEKIIELPFSSIEKLDYFTSLFNSQKELAKLLFRDENYPVENIKVAYTYKIPGQDHVAIKYLPVKYSCDTFDSEDLKEKFRNYILRNPKEILNKDWGLIYVIRNTRYKNNIGGEIRDYEIDNAINNLWDKGYKTKRDIYFKLINKGIEVKVNPVSSFYEKSNLYKNDINKFTSNDPYFEYLQGLSLRGGEEEEYAIEQISMFDLDKIPTENISNDHSSLLDGVEESENIEERLISRLEKLSKKNRDELVKEICLIRDSFSKGKKKCKK